MSTINLTDLNSGKNPVVIQVRIESETSTTRHATHKHISHMRIIIINFHPITYKQNPYN